MLGFLLLFFFLIFGTIAVSKTNVKLSFLLKRRDSPMYGIPDRLKALSAAEEQVLPGCGTGKPPVSRRDIGARRGRKGWAAATVLNFLYRLEEKAGSPAPKSQNHNLYAPPSPAGPTASTPCASGSDTVFGGDLGAGCAGAGERERLLSERAGTGHRRSERKARRSGRI